MVSDSTDMMSKHKTRNMLYTIYDILDVLDLHNDAIWQFGLKRTNTTGPESLHH